MSLSRPDTMLVSPLTAEVTGAKTLVSVFVAVLIRSVAVDVCANAP